METTINQRFEIVINKCIDRGFVVNQADFSKKIEVKPSRISEIKAGRMGISSEICNTLHRLFGVDMNWLITGIGEIFSDDTNLKPVVKEEIPLYARLRDDMLNIPILDLSMSAGVIAHINNDYVETVDHLSIPRNMLNSSSSSYICARVRGESMSPTMYDSDKIIMRLLDRSEWGNMPDEHVYAIISKDGAQIKRVKNRMKKGFIVCMSDNVDKVSYPNFNLLTDDIVSIWHAELHLSNKFPNINDSYYRRVRNLEDRVEEMGEMIKKILK